MTTTEPEWDVEQQTLMHAYQAWVDDRCPCGCGQQMSDCLHDADAEDQTAYAAAYYTCNANAAMHAAHETQRETDEKAEKSNGKPVYTSNRLWTVTPRTP